MHNIDVCIIYESYSAVEILKSCALTNQITFLISRDDKSKQDFRRLSNSLLQATDGYYTQC